MLSMAARRTRRRSSTQNGRLVVGGVPPAARLGGSQGHRWTAGSCGRAGRKRRRRPSAAAHAPSGWASARRAGRRGLCRCRPAEAAPSAACAHREDSRRRVGPACAPRGGGPCQAAAGGEGVQAAQRRTGGCGWSARARARRASTARPCPSGGPPPRLGEGPARRPWRGRAGRRLQSRGCAGQWRRVTAPLQHQAGACGGTGES
mmetsp:Transcript_26977/g.72735  ORF Transcript_26977/g.72735 Transcript_26977/m.72735 type:complete len:204 (+) Transcript_26977:470-1081(+)